MTPSPDQGLPPRLGRALVIAAGIHGLAIAAMSVRVLWPVDADPQTPAIAVDMAEPAAVPAPIHDVPTPRQIEAPQPKPKNAQEPKRPLFDTPPPLSDARIQPDVVVPPEKKEEPKPNPSDPLPPAPATTELSAPQLKQDLRTSAMVTNGAANGKATPDAMWDARVRARIELTKRYPGEAASRDQRDDVNMLLTLDRNGRLLNARVIASRGYPLLDEAALAAVRQASPYPKPPREIAGDPVRLSVIVRFYRRVR